MVGFFIAKKMREIAWNCEKDFVCLYCNEKRTPYE